MVKKEKRKSYGAMDEAEQEEYNAEIISLPIEWHIPESIQSRYVTNVIVQAGANEIFVSFFESQIPIFIGNQEESNVELKRSTTVKAECIGRFVVAPDLMPDIINALQTSTDAYWRSKENKQMSKLILRTASWKAPKSQASIPVLPAVAAKDVASFVSITHVVPSGESESTSEKQFQDSTDQMAWDIYKRIEPRYSDANSRLAK